MGPRTRSSTPKKETLAETATQSSTKKRRTRSLSQGDKSVEASPLTPPKKTTPILDSPSKKSNNRKTSNPNAVTPKSPSTQPPSPSVDLMVHRLRYLRHIPSAILCIKPSPTAGKKKGNPSDTYVAISRQGGSIELRSARQKFRVLATVAGWSSAAIHTMAWTHHRSLVGATADGTLVLIDFQRGHFRNVTSSGGGQIHALDSFASHHGDVSCPTLVAAACEDGSVRYFDVDVQQEADMNMPMPVVSTIPSTGAPILSLALNRFGAVSKEKRSASPLVGATVFVGVADGTIRRYDCVQGSSWRSIFRITVENMGRSIPTRVWVLKSLQDGTLVSGDSLGHVQMWDGHSGTLEATFNQNEVKADVLALDVTREENKVFASGVDSRVICIERSGTVTEDRKWVFANAQRPHTHDVQAIAVCYRSRKKGSGGSEILCTGGIDTKLCTFAVNDFQRQRPHTLFPWPVRSPIVIAPERRVISIMRKGSIQIYSLAPRPVSLESRLQVTETDTFLGTVQIDSPFNLSVSTISADGKYLVVGNPSNLLLFQLTYKSGQGSSNAQIRPERLPFELPSQATIVAAKFLRNDRLVLCSADSDVLIVNVGEGERNISQVSIQSTISFAPDDTDVPSMLPHDEIACSSDGEWFSIMRSSSEKGSVQVFKDVDGTFVHWWSIPELEDPPAVAAFLHTDHPQLVVVCASFAPYVFDLEERSLSTWSRGVPFPVGESLPLSLSNRKDYPVRITVNPAAPTQFFVVSLFVEDRMSCQCKDSYSGTYECSSLPLLSGLSSLRDQGLVPFLLSWTKTQMIQTFREGSHFVAF